MRKPAAEDYTFDFGETGNQSGGRTSGSWDISVRYWARPMHPGLSGWYGMELRRPTDGPEPTPASKGPRDDGWECWDKALQILHWPQLQ